MNATSTSATRLHGHWLLIARVAWVALIALSLGVLAASIPPGFQPFRHQNPGALLIAHMTQPPPDACVLVFELPTKVASALQRAPAKNPEERYATAGEFVRVLAHSANGL
jgi:serine/threonine-protein kinase